MPMILYSFKICPFVERTNVLLNEKSIECERVYVDIRDKPDWFLKLSPFGKVPVLNVDGVILFESSVINEFFDEISSPPSLYPADPVQKAHNRSWIEWGSSLVFDAYYMTLAKNQEEFVEKSKIVYQKLTLLEEQVKKSPFFDGDEFSMIDLAYAPLFRRFDSLSRQFAIEVLKPYPKLQSWSRCILARPSVQRGFAANFDEEFESLLKLKGSCLT